MLDALVVVAVVIRITIISSFTFILLPTPAHANLEDFKPIYRQDETIRTTKSKEVLRYMNLSADPCEDFYEFSCGNWAKFHTLLKENEIATPSSYLEMKVNTDLQNMLEEPETLEDSTSAREVKTFYKSCLACERNGQVQQAFFSEFIKNNSGFPAVPGSNWLLHSHNYNWQQVVGLLRYHYGMEILIGMKIELNHLNPYENSIYLGQPSSFIPPELCNAEGTRNVDIRERAYEPIEREVADNLRMWLTLSKHEARQLAADIVTFEFDLCAGMALESQLKNQSVMLNFKRRTLIDFTHQFNDSIDFNRFVTWSFGTPMPKPVFMSNERYFEQLINTIKDNNMTTVANYIMYRALSMLSFPHDDHTGNRPHYCLAITKRFFPRAAGEMYQKKYTNPATRREVMQMYEKIRSSFLQSLRKPWIDQRTSVIGERNLLQINLDFPSNDKEPPLNFRLGHSDYWHNLIELMAQVQKQQLYHFEAYETRLKYRATHKRIDIGWGLLQEPFYESLLPNTMRYAMIGQKIAAELATAFDDINWTSDYSRLSNWDVQTSEEYLNRTECFRRQLSNYLSNDPESFQNVTRIRELVALSGGLNVAFGAYLNWLKYLSPNNDFAILKKETLPELNFTNTQLFFITYAQMYCRADKRAKAPSIYTPLLKHTVERYEVNGPLRNFEEFARDFSCPTGVDMNPADRCVIY